MYIELRHLRTIRAIQESGGLARAAEVMNMTQSALSHQVKGLEDQAGVELFVGRSKALRLVVDTPHEPGTKRLGAWDGATSRLIA